MLGFKPLAVLRAAVSLALVLVLLSQVDLSMFLLGIKQAELFFLAIAFAISALTIWIRSYKWQLLLRVHGANLSLSRLHSLNYIALFFNNFFLGSLGGDAYRIYKTFDQPKGRSGAVCSVIVEKLTNLLILFVMVLSFGALSVYTGNSLTSQRQLVTIGAYGAATFMLVYVVFAVLRRVKNPSVLQPRSGVVQKCFHAFAIYRNYKKALLISLLLSLLFYMMNIIATYFFALTANVHIGLIDLSFMVAAVFLVVMIPISLNGIGLQEGAFVLYLSALRVDSSSAVLFALLPRMVMVIFSLIGGLLYLVDNLRHETFQEVQ